MLLMMAGQGRITHGPKKTLAERTLDFVQKQLGKWRDDPTRIAVSSEDDLNAQLCKFLTVAARAEFPMIFFHHEERQAGQRYIDLSAHPTAPVIIGARSYSIYDPFLVLEGKRLPSPASSREREYVTGAGEKSGAIQRFKLGLHGARLNTVSIIAYIQRESFLHWHRTINGWISDLAIQPQSQDEVWIAQEQLQRLRISTKRRVARSSSTANRVGDVVSSAVRIEHLWVEMRGR